MRSPRPTPTSRRSAASGPAWRVLVVALALMGCTVPSTPAATHAPTLQLAPASEQPHRELIIGIDDAPRALGDLFVADTDSSAGQILELYHAPLTTLDERGATVPRLAEAAPSVENGTWRLNPDGTMDTIYRLRPELHWHDGAPFTAGDVVFGYRIRTDPAVGAASRAAMDAITSVEAPDSLTVAVRWKRLYWGADSVREQLLPYPEHLLAAHWRDEPSSLLLDPYWTGGFVGLGPFRVAAFVPGDRLELTSFDSYAFGRPRIGEIKVWLGLAHDELRAMLEDGALDVGLAPSLNAADAMGLRTTWDAAQRGETITYPGHNVLLIFQLRPVGAGSALHDPAVRRSLALAINRQQTNFVESLGLAPTLTAWVPSVALAPSGRSREDLDRYDPNRAFALLAEHGWNRGEDGFLRGPGAEPLQIQLDTADAPRALATVARFWGEIGVTVESHHHDRAAVGWERGASGAVLVTSPRGPSTLARLGLPSSPRFHSTEDVPVSLGWASPEADALLQRLAGPLHPAELTAMQAELAQLVGRDVPVLRVASRVSVLPVAAGVEGPRARSGFNLRPWVAFNAHEWTLRGA
ncbi:MAG: peptide/nickel transport system substrate-binding protein [Chloroflexota bacterium]|nr:peptide/nickel transport system substrate-binding protein [Chloroflexota bacterium]